MLKRILFLIAIVCIASSVMAQVTTSSLTGNIIRAGGEPLVGATVKATHVPTGTTYVTVTRSGGVYNIVNMVPGGPYTIDVTFVGFQPVTQSNVTLPLGENTRFDSELSTSTETLTAVVVSTTGGAAARKKTGASTSIGKEQIASLPTLNRSLQDFTRLTPQA